MSSNRPEFVVALRAVWRLGAAVVLISPAWKRDEVRHALTLTTPGHAVGDNPVLAELMPMLHLDDPIVPAMGGTEAPAPDPDDEAVLVFSSGTTGMPKAVRHTHRSIRGRDGALVRCARARPPTTASRWPPRRRTSSGCSTSLAALGRRDRAAAPPVRPRRGAAPDRVRPHDLEMAVAPIALAMANHPNSRLRPLVAALHHVGRDAGDRERRRASPRAPASAGCPPTAPASCRSSRATRCDGARRWRLDSAGLPPRASSCASPTSTPARSLPAGRDRRDPGAVSPSVMAGLPPRGGDRRRVRRRLVPHRRRRLARARGVGAHHRPLEGDDQGQRLPGGAGRDRGGAARPPGRARLRGVRRPRRRRRRGGRRRRRACRHAGPSTPTS